MTIRRSNHVWWVSLLLCKQSAHKSVFKKSFLLFVVTGSNLSDTWEGREGRLFAYELIFRYLIKNHWLYTFGPAGSGSQLDAGARYTNWFPCHTFSLTLRLLMLLLLLLLLWT